MRKTRFLSKEEKETGLKYHLRFQFFNGAGFNFIGDTPITLLAIYFGATNVQLGYIASTIYITGVLLLLVPKIFAGRNLARLYFWSWLFRGAICLLYTALWWVSGSTAVLIILATYTLFCAARIIGSALYQPLLRMISTAQNRGEVVARSSINFQLSLTGSKLFSFLVTSIQRFSGIVGLLLLQYLGIIFNTLAAFSNRKIPCRETVTHRKGQNLGRIFISSMKNKTLRSAVLLNWITIALMILFGFIVPFLRREAGFSTGEVFLFTMAASLSNLLAGYYTKTFADRLGSKPLLIGGTIGLGICFIVWVFLPPASSISLIFFLGFITGFFLYSNNMLVNRVIIRRLPEGDSVGTNSMINFVVALISIVIGTGGGWLADNQSMWNLPLTNGYSLTFASAVLFSVISLFLGLRLREPESRSGREVVGIMFSPSNLQTFWQIGRLNRVSDPITRRTLLVHIGKTDNQMTTEEIHSIMAAPLSPDKSEIIKNLFSFPRMELLPDLLNEAANPSSRNRSEAIFALGAYKTPDSVNLLQKLLIDSNSEVRSNAAKSLGRLKQTVLLETIRSQAEKAEGIWNRMNYIVALKNLDNKGEYLGRLFSDRILKENSLHRQTLYSLYADVLNFLPSLDEIYRERNLEKGLGLEDFLDEARDVPGFLESRKDFVDWFAEDRPEQVCLRCRELLSGITAEPRLEYLKTAIITLPVDGRDYDDALAVLYFSYQLLKRRIEH